MPSCRNIACELIPGSPPPFLFFVEARGEPAERGERLSIPGSYCSQKKLTNVTPEGPALIICSVLLDAGSRQIHLLALHISLCCSSVYINELGPIIGKQDKCQLEFAYVGCNMQLLFTN